MADMRTAKAGDKLTARAKKKLSRFGIYVPEQVSPKTDAKAGQWVCIDCGAPMQNNWEAQSHGHDQPKHRLAWRSGETGDFEEP